VLLEELERVLGEPLVQRGKAAGHGRVGPQLVDARAGFALLASGVTGGKGNQTDENKRRYYEDFGSHG
jgi:hypothetical protein